MTIPGRIVDLRWPVPPGSPEIEVSMRHPKDFVNELVHSNLKRGADPSDAHCWGAMFVKSIQAWVAVIPRTELRDRHRMRVPGSPEFHTPEEASKCARAYWRELQEASVQRQPLRADLYAGRAL